MTFTLPDLPFAKDAFADTISTETFDFHHGKHHKAYVDKTNELLVEIGKLKGASLSKVIVAAKDSGNNELFNNAAQTWNHSFYWQCLSPDAQRPSTRLAALIDEGFGSTSKFLEAFKEVAIGHFGSGWAWLVLDNQKLKITSLHDADTPIVHDMKPLLTIDIWEHAYYIDYRNERPDYLASLLEKGINWQFVAQNLDGEGVSRADQA